MSPRTFGRSFVATAATGLALGAFGQAGAAQEAVPSPDWADAMREVHARFDGIPGTLACFGDSITDTMAFWAPLPYERKNAPPDMEEAFTAVNDYLQPECWRDWKGPEFGNQGGQTAAWALANVDQWLRDLRPEVALIMFGTNDLSNVDDGTYREQLSALVDRCLSNGTVVILSTIPPRSGFAERAAQFAGVARAIAAERRIPLTDFHREILSRRSDDWDGSLPQFAGHEGYDVPTLIARDGAHPSHPTAYQNDYSPEALSRCGYSLRNYTALMAYAEVLESVLR